MLPSSSPTTHQKKKKIKDYRFGVTFVFLYCRNMRNSRIEDPSLGLHSYLKTWPISRTTKKYDEVRKIQEDTHILYIRYHSCPPEEVYYPQQNTESNLFTIISMHWGYFPHKLLIIYNLDSKEAKSLSLTHPCFSPNSTPILYMPNTKFLVFNYN